MRPMAHFLCLNFRVLEASIGWRVVGKHQQGLEQK